MNGIRPLKSHDANELFEKLLENYMNPMTYSDAKTISETMYSECRTLADAMDLIIEGMGMVRGATGLTPDAVRKTPEWKAARNNYDKAWARMGKFNRWFSRTFKTEIRADRDTKRAARSSGSSNENLYAQSR